MVIGSKSQEKRMGKCLTERGEYEFTEHETEFTVHTYGGSYTVTRNACSCPDHQNRCVEEHIYCKHRVAVWLRILEEGREPAKVWEAKDTRRCEIAIEQAKQENDAEPESPASGTDYGLDYRNRKAQALAAAQEQDRKAREEAAFQRIFS